MSGFSLIADSGIQFIRVYFDLRDFKLSRINCKIGTKEVVENDQKFAIPLMVEYDSQKDAYVDSKGNIVDNDKFNIIKASQALSLFQGRWLPLPYFIEEQYRGENSYIGGPIGWCRGIIQKAKGSADNYVLVLAFDTYLDRDGDSEYNSNKHMTLTGNNVKTGVAKVSLVDNINENSNLLEEEWMHEYLQLILKENGRVAGISKAFIEKNYFYYLGIYIAYLRFLKEFAPVISIYEPQKEHKIDVDFVLDIGNSRSCGVLLESTQQKFHTFDFTTATTFHLRDLQKPHIMYSEPFEMKVEFVKANFGEFEIDSWKKAFYWPSVVRVGKEAIDRVFAVGKLDVPTGMSSPKRYLWDNSPREISWYFNPGNLGIEPEPVGSGKTILSELMVDVQGKLSNVTDMELKGRYSRKAMMTFTLIEIFLQAALYINSDEFRERNGNPKYQRVLKRVVLTTPTAMLNTDKKTFRECANSAVEILKEFYSKDGESIFDHIEIVPSAGDVITNPDQASEIIERKEWGFDEATCVQLAFMYGEITNKYQNNSELFFEIEGRDRKVIDRAGNTVRKRCVNVASLDIGGGTTDLMICSYINESQGNVSVLVPYPEFYEGFNIAGDDILKRIIERLVIRAIERYSDKLGCRDTKSCINFLFGDYVSSHTSSDKEYKKYITSQFLVPIALYALEIASEEDDRMEKRNFNEIIDELRRGDRIRDNILEYVNGYFRESGARGFKLDEIEFIFSAKEINGIISQVMAPVINRLSMIIRQMRCDYFIIAGQPSKLKVIKNLVNRYLPITPDRVIPMGDYHIGRWYPFAKSNGLINDPKTTVAVGATVALMGGTMLKLDGFRIDTYYLKEKVKSTARYIGGYDTKNRGVRSLIFTPQDGGNDGQIVYNGATYIGMKQLSGENWPGACMYRIDFKDDKIAKALSKRLPLKISLQRSPQNPEIIIKSLIEDKNDMPIRSEYIVLIPQTLGNEDGYWLDTGIFHTAMF